MVFSKAVGSEVAGEMFCPLTRSDCHPACALLQYHLEVNDEREYVRRSFACGLAVNESMYWEPACAVKQTDFKEEFKGE